MSEAGFKDAENIDPDSLKDRPLCWRVGVELPGQAAPLL
jgi:hypothetical protein